jgi:hypothetical protein
LVAVWVFVAVAVLVGVRVGVSVGVVVGVSVGVPVAVRVGVRVAVLVGVLLGVAVGVSVGVLVGVSVGVGVGVSVGVGVLQATKTPFVVDALTGKPPKPPMPIGMVSASTPIAVAWSCKNRVVCWSAIRGRRRRRRSWKPCIGGAVLQTLARLSSTVQEVKSGPAPVIPSFGAMKLAHATRGTIVPPGKGTWFVTTSPATP